MVHHAPAVDENEALSVQVICLANKTGDDRNEPPTETMQAQSVETVFEQGFVGPVLDIPLLLRQFRDQFYQGLARHKETVLPKTVCTELVRVSKMDRSDAAYADARANAIQNAHKCVHHWHVGLRREERDVTDDEHVDDEPPEYDGPLGRQWRRVDSKGLVRVRTTRGTTLGPHAHTWTPLAESSGGVLVHAGESWQAPNGNKIYFKGVGSMYRGVYAFPLTGPYRREVGLLQKGTGYLVVTADGEPDAFIPLQPKMVLSIDHGAQCRFIVSSQLQKAYVYQDCRKAAMHIKNPDGGVASLAEDAALQFDTDKCDKCGAVAWEESFSGTVTAGKGVEDLCRKCWSEQPAARQAEFGRRVFGKAAMPGAAGSAMCGCSLCWTLPKGYSRITEDELVNLKAAPSGEAAAPAQKARQQRGVMSASKTPPQAPRRRAKSEVRSK